LIALAGFTNGGEREGKEKKERKTREKKKEKKREKDYFPQPLSPTVPEPRHFDHHIQFKAMHRLTITYC
jgi:hypothetical protein